MDAAATSEAMSTQATLRTIVAATDFSANAGVALTWAEQLARQHHATLVLVHAFQAEPIALPELGGLLRAHHDEIRARMLAQLEREAERARTGGVRVDCELAAGAASEVVIAAAQRREADLVVVGTRGHNSWGRLLLGSTAARLVRHARCPVLTIHETDGPPRMFRTVLVPTDLSKDAALATDAAARVLGRIGAADRHIVLLHAYNVPYQATYLPAPILMDAISAVDVTVKRAIEKLASKLRDTGINVDAVTCTGYPPQMVLQQAASISADLIAMATHGRSGMDRLFLGSTAEEVLGSATCPVLTVRN